MSKPSIDVTFEPRINNIVRFLRCAPHVKGKPETGLLNLRMTIENTGDDPVRINRIVILVENAGADYPALDISVTLPASKDPALQRGDTLAWTQSDDYIFQISQNPRLHVQFFADGHAASHVEILNVELHVNPGGSYKFWGKKSDLEAKEFWRVHGTRHSNTKAQMFAYDVGVGVALNDSVTERRSDPNGILMDGTKNDHFRVWGKPIYAIGDGTVVHCRNDFPGNPRPLREDEDFADAFPDMAQLIDDIGDGNGNFFTITNGGETILYAHMQEGSLNERFVNAFNAGDTVQVSAGDFLGLAGNAGQSSKPHLRIHANRTTPGDTSSWNDLARPMNFNSAFALKWSEIGSNGKSGPWVQLKGRGMPTTGCAVWPGKYMFVGPAGPIVYSEELTVDDLAQFIPAHIYAKLKSPNPPPVEGVWKYMASLVRKMNRKEKAETSEHLSALGEFVDALKEEIRGAAGKKNT